MFADHISSLEVVKQIMSFTIHDWVGSVLIFMPELIVLYILSTLGDDSLNRMACVVVFVSLWFYHP